MSESAVRVLLVEDNPGDAELIRKALSGATGRRFDLSQAEELGEALTLLEQEPVEVLLLDLSLPDSQGLDTFREAYRSAPETPILVLTGLSDEAMAVRTVHEGAQDYLVKGELDPRTLVRAICYAIERKRAEVARRESERRFRAIFDSALQFIGLLTPDGTVLEVNQTALDFGGLRPEDVIGRPFWEARWWTVSPESRDQLRDAIEQAAAGQLVRYEVDVRGAGDAAATIDFSLKPLLDDSEQVSLLISEGRDITERKLAERERDRLLASEREKSEQLKLSVREAHHRIKNNLQAISDLLYLELESGTGVSPRDALRESIERLQAIALVHDLLSLDQDVQTVDLQALAERLVPMVLRSCAISRDVVSVTVQVPSVRLSSRRSTTMALILNELVSNAAKHAFRDGRRGNLSITIRLDSEELVLQVRDDGPGLPDGFSFSTHAHVGLEVVRVMAERDLSGSLTLKNEGGLLAEVRIPW